MGRRNTDDEGQYSSRFDQALGRTIKVLRTDLGIERRTLADNAGISYSYLTEIENGNKPPSPSALGPIARALGLQMSELIDAAERRMERQQPELAAGSPEESTESAVRSSESVSRSLPSPRLFTTADYATQPSVRGSRRDLRGAIIELERLVQNMSPEDIDRLLDFARRLTR